MSSRQQGPRPSARPCTQIDLRFDSDDQGKLQVVVAPVLRFRDVGYNADVRIDELGPPQKLIEGARGPAGRPASRPASQPVGAGQGGVRAVAYPGRGRGLEGTRGWQAFPLSQPRAMLGNTSLTSLSSCKGLHHLQGLRAASWPPAGPGLSIWGGTTQKQRA
jgi:hypothetical protein